MKPFIVVTLKCPDLEKPYDIEVPTNVNVGKLTGDLIETINESLPEKQPMDGSDYCIRSERLGRTLWKNETLEEAGIQNGDTIVIEKRGERPRIIGPGKGTGEEEEEKKEKQPKGMYRITMAAIAAGIVLALIICIKSIIGGLNTSGPHTEDPSGLTSKETGGTGENDTGNSSVEYRIVDSNSGTEEAGKSKTENAGGSKTENAGGSKTENAGGSKTKNAGGSGTENAGGSKTENAGGSKTTEKKGNEPVEPDEPDEPVDPVPVTPLIYDASTVEDYSANLNPDNYHYYNPNFSDSHAKAFSFAYPPNLFNYAYSDFEDDGKGNIETHTLSGIYGSFMKVGIYRRTGNDNLSLSDKVDQILSREGVGIEERKNVIRKEVLSDRGYAWGAETGYGFGGSIVYIMTRVYDDYVMLLYLDSPYTGYHEKKDEDFYRKCYVQECIYKMCGFAAEDAGSLRSYEEYLKDL